MQEIVSRIKKKSPHSKIAVSSIIIRKDSQTRNINIKENISKLNNSVKQLCDENLIDYIDNDNIDDSCLGVKQLHLNKKGNVIFAKNIITYLRAL